MAELHPNSKHWFTTSFFSTTVFGYVIGSWKLSANEQFFFGVRTVVSLLQTTQIKQGVLFIAGNKVYTRTNKTTIIWIEMELFLLLFLPGVGPHVYVGAWALGCFHSHISTQTFRRALTASVDSCAERKSASSVAKPNLAEFGGRSGKRCSECAVHPKAWITLTNKHNQEGELAFPAVNASMAPALLVRVRLSPGLRTLETCSIWKLGSRKTFLNLEHFGPTTLTSHSGDSVSSRASIYW